MENGVDTSSGIAFEDVKYKSGVVPSVTGMGLSDALYMLGNAGYKVKVRGKWFSYQSIGNRRERDT